MGLYCAHTAKPVRQVRAYVSQLLSIVEILIVNVLRRHKAIELSFMTEKEGAANF